MWAEDDRPTKDQLGLLLAQVWSYRGTCARRRVGCVLMDATGKEIGTGYNGPAAGELHCRSFKRDPLPPSLCAGRGLPSGQGLEKCEAIHAEQNALLSCSDVTLIHTCYVTASPCLHCVKMLANTGAWRIVFLEDYAGSDTAQTWWLRKAGREWIKHGNGTALLREVQGAGGSTSGAGGGRTDHE